MNNTDFAGIASRYEQDSIVQKSAAGKLIGLLDIRRTDEILDLGCGTGNLTRKIRAMTDEAVVGVDPSTDMISEAENGRQGLNIKYEVKPAEELDYRDRFTVIFCNSAFQWFRDVDRALRNCYTALLKGGRIGVQAPAKKVYCPNFVQAIDEVSRDPRTAGTFTGFRAPWIFLDKEKEYSSLFERAGFSVPFAVIEEIKTLYAPAEVVTIFESGAAAGYLNQAFYETPVNDAYGKAFREIVKESFQRQANGTGQVELTFNRIYLLAVK